LARLTNKENYEACTNNRNHRPGWFVFGRVFAADGVRGSWSNKAIKLFLDWSNRAPLQGLARGKFDSNDPDRDIDRSLDKIKPPIWHTRLFWTVSISLFVSLWLFVAGACLLAFNSDSRTSSVQVWRLFFFLGGLPIIWWIGDIVTRAIVWSVEKAINVKNALFFVYRVRVGLLQFHPALQPCPPDITASIVICFELLYAIVPPSSL